MVRKKTYIGEKGQLRTDYRCQLSRGKKSWKLEKRENWKTKLERKKESSTTEKREH
jgi:hypothetical protein